MITEMKTYLQSLKATSAWDEEAPIATIKSIMKHYIGEPPSEIVHLDVFMETLKKVVRNGYTASSGGDVSEPGFDRQTQRAIVPDFDIPSAYINDDARQFRYSNETTTDDHGLHLVGYLEKDGKDWYLIKDSGSGSRNNDPKAGEFGYCFFSSDYIKLKMMDYMVHKDAVKDLLEKFNSN
jgi:bleomycin hydrolase